MGETERKALRQIEDWCLDSLDDIDAKHGSLQRLVLAVIPTIAANALASLPAEPDTGEVERLAMTLSAEGDSPDATRSWWSTRTKNTQERYRARASALIAQAASLASPDSR